MMATALAPQRGSRAQGWLGLLRCPISGKPLTLKDGELVTADGNYRYRLDGSGIPLFAEQLCSPEARAQEAHYEKIAAAYLSNLQYPHTREYSAYLDEALIRVVDEASLGTVAEICCGRGEAFHLFGDKISRGIGVDVSQSMLRAAQNEHSERPLFFVQGDATMLPLATAAFDSVFMLGGIHHVNDRRALFAEIGRILKPGGRFYFREPVSDLAVWRWLRAAIYRVSPILDYDTERPLRYRETVPLLEDAGLDSCHWETHGFLGFCILMNSDVLVFNRLFRFIPGIRQISRWSANFDEWVLRLPAMRSAGLQVVGVAERRRGAS